MNSIETFKVEANSPVRRSVARRPTMTPKTASSPLRLSRRTMIVLDTSPESANTSPWAKLISCRIP